LGRQVGNVLGKIARFFGGCFFLFSVSASSSQKLYHPEIQAIVDRGYLVVALHHTDHPPFFMLDHNGELIGLDIEIAHKIARALNVKVKFHRESTTFDQIVDTIAHEQADIGISKISYTAERAKKVLFSKPYITLRKALLINRVNYARLKRAIKANNLKELFNHDSSIIGVLRSTSYEYYAKELFPGAPLNAQQSWDKEIVPGVMGGSVLAIFRDELEMKKYLLLNTQANLSVMPIILKDEKDSIQMIVPPKKPYLQYWVNKFIEEEKLDLTVDSLLEKYRFYFEWVKEQSEQMTK
jgi:polar amino acid transport system substrate-binding protein